MVLSNHCRDLFKRVLTVAVLKKSLKTILLGKTFCFVLNFIKIGQRVIEILVLDRALLP